VQISKSFSVLFSRSLAVILLTACSSADISSPPGSDLGPMVPLEDASAGSDQLPPPFADQGVDQAPSEDQSVDALPVLDQLVDVDLSPDQTLDAGAPPDQFADQLAPPVMDKPVIEGESSVGHDQPTWTWTTPASTDYFRVRLNGNTWLSVASNKYVSPSLPEGAYLIEVQACSVNNVCSVAASFQTTVEFFGKNFPPFWKGVSKMNLATTVLGNMSPISCHNCYNGPANEVLSVLEARAKIEQAQLNDADLIEIDIADAAGTLCATHDDVPSCASLPTLKDLLAHPPLVNGHAMLFLEIKEQNATPAQFAAQLLTTLNEQREVYVRNGRPIFLRAFRGRLPYLLALKQSLDSYPFLKHYVRFSVLYGKNEIADVKGFQDSIQADVIDNGLQMVELDYTNNNILGLTRFARANGLGVGVYTIPGAFGEVFVAALREEVDQITAEYRADQARSIIEETNVFAYLNASNCASAADTTVVLKENTTGATNTTAIILHSPAGPNSFGAPSLAYEPAGQDWYGCSLDYRSNQSLTERALDLGPHPVGANTGYLVTAYVNFDALSGFSGTQAIMNSTEAGGFALELISDGVTTDLRFGVHVNGSYHYKTYEVSQTGVAGVQTINDWDGYYLVGAYDGDGGVYLWLNNGGTGAGATLTGAVTDSNQSVLVGADPQPSDPLGARYFFDGLIQQVSVLRWGDHSFSGSTVND
jgi:hypothetical protein